MIQLLSFLSDIDNAQSINEAFPIKKKKEAFCTYIRVSSYPL